MILSILTILSLNNKCILCYILEVVLIIDVEVDPKEVKIKEKKV